MHMNRAAWMTPGLAIALLCVACGQPTDPSSVPSLRHETGPEAAWVESLAARLDDIDEAMPGRLGVHVRRLTDDSRLDHRGDRDWYLASVIKVPVAIAVLEQVEAGELSLEQSLTLREEDFVDGAGELIWREPGVTVTVAELIERSITDSDSTATDMLIRLVGEDHLNARLRAWTDGGFNAITTIIQVRYDVYAAAHPGVADLTNMEVVSLRNADVGEPRLQALAEVLGVARTDLQADDFEQLFEQYYASGLNSARLAAVGELLTRLARGELLDGHHTDLLLAHMRSINTGDRRIVSGLPSGIDFAQKTGTQVARACNVGVIAPDKGGAVVIAACAEAFDDLAQVEQAFQQVGRALDEVGLLDPGQGE
jgi:beta-lactamase class A